MGLETVLEHIRDTGKAEASAIIAEGQRERERVLAEAREQGQKTAGHREAEAREQAERRRVQDLARAELDAKKLVLAAQATVLQAVRDRLKTRLASETSSAAIQRLLAKYAAEWKTGRVYSNARDAPAVRSIVGERFAATLECSGGVVIESADGASKLDLTYDSILADLWDDVIKEVAQILWPRK